MNKLIPKFQNSGIIENSQTSSEDDKGRTKALQNPDQSWIQNYRDYTGRRGTLTERNNFKQDYVSKENVDARMGEGIYDKLREEAIQQQFGTQGYDSGTRGEKRRFDRRFNRNLRKYKLQPKPVISEPTNNTSTKAQVIYPILRNFNINPIRSTYMVGKADDA